MPSPEGPSWIQLLQERLERQAELEHEREQMRLEHEFERLEHREEGSGGRP